MMALSMNQTEKDMRGAAGHLVPIEGVVGERVGAVGFARRLAVWAAAASPLVSARRELLLRHAPHGKPDFTRISGAVLGHFGTADEFVFFEDGRALETELCAAGVDTDTPSSTTPTGWHG